MAWYEILVGVLGAVGGVGGFVSLYKAKPAKVQMEIGNLQEALKTVSEEHARYKESAEGMIASLRARIEKVDKRNAVMDMAIRSAFQCQHVKDSEECPVLVNYQRLCDKNEGTCEVNI